MRHSLRRAALWLGAALLGVVALGVALAEPASLGHGAILGLAAAGINGVVFGLVFGIAALLAGIGEARLRAGLGEIARWTIQPTAWEAFRAFDARRAREGPRLVNDHTPRPATAPVAIRFGRHQVIVDGAYHPLRRWAVPGLVGLGWLHPPDGPECFEFALVYPRGRYGTQQVALRVPVAAGARGEAIRVFEHFAASLPRAREGLATRRPWLVIAWGLGVTAACAIAGGVGLLLAESGSASTGVLVMAIGGVMGAIGGAVFTALIALKALPGRKG